VVTNEQAEILNRDPQNQEYMDHAVIADKLDTAMDFAYNTTGTDNVIIFDGAMEGLNLSKPLAKRLKEKAEEVSKRVDNDLMPKWLKQRGLDPSILK